MGRLSPTELRGRLALDYGAIRRMTGGALGAVRAYDSAANFKAGREVPEGEARQGAAVLYRIDYAFDNLVGRDRVAHRGIATFDLLGGGNYPYTAPYVTFISRPRPWSPHVHPETGFVCLGNGWERADGNILLAHLVVHVARLVNFDEPDTGHLGYNPESAEYWRQVLGGRPYLPDLVYPALPADITHGVSDAAVFRPALPSVGNGFRPTGRVHVRRVG